MISLAWAAAMIITLFAAFFAASIGEPIWAGLNFICACVAMEMCIKSIETPPSP